jgi:radical SAM protein with 4Fe4S-binding SPASM domain
MLDAKLLREKILPEKDTLYSILFYFQGEPYLHPEFTDLVHTASSLGIYTAASTNAHYLNEENAIKTVESGLDELIISVDGTTQETYSRYRAGGELSKVLAGTKEILKQRGLRKSKSPYVIWQFIVFRHNEREVDEIKRLGKEYGVDEVAVKTAQIYDTVNAADMIPVNEAYSRYRKNADGKYVIRNKMLDQCWRMWSSSVVTWDGKVVPCCFDKDAKHVLGNLKTGDLTEIWKSSVYSDFRRTILKGRSGVDICTNCTEGTKVWAD